MQQQVYSLQTERLRLTFETDDQHLQQMQLSADGQPWLTENTTLFAVSIDDQRYDARDFRLDDFRIEAADGIQHAIATLSGHSLQVEHHVCAYEATALIEQWQVIRATGEARRITRVDSLALDFAPAAYDLLHFDSDWGVEFKPERQPLTDAITLETRLGRASKGEHPYFALLGEAGVIAGSVAWSGNWCVRFEPSESGVQVSGGLNDWAFERRLTPESTLETPRVVLAFGKSLDDTARQFAQVGRRWWIPHNALSTALPVEWNHWWSYEDVDLTAERFKANVAAAAELGVELCTLDAGWFGASFARVGETDSIGFAGESSETPSWTELRGDWALVNTVRFPDGIRAIADDVHAHGMAFGLWCEIEGLGKQAALNSQRPDFPALRDGEALGYVCFGNPDAEQWAYETLSRLIRDYDADWIKLDFNLEPFGGCNRTDHGHGAGDGLYAHYRGYYRLLDRIRAAFPDVVLENCASGGLRIDLEMLRHTHLTFLSDPDWLTHDLQVFWGATSMLPPDACLHWSTSEWRGTPPPQQHFNPRDPALTAHQFDSYTRAGMLGAFGMSQKLPELPDWVRDRLAEHIRIYKDTVRRFVREAELHRLTDQPHRDGSGERWCAFQYVMPDESEHLLFVFRLSSGETRRVIRLEGLVPDRVYQVRAVDGTNSESRTGRDLMDVGLAFELREEESALVRIW